MLFDVIVYLLMFANGKEGVNQILPVVTRAPHPNTAFNVQRHQTKHKQAICFHLNSNLNFSEHSSRHDNGLINQSKWHQRAVLIDVSTSKLYA